MRNSILFWTSNRYVSSAYRTNPDRFGHLAPQSLLSVFGYSTGISAPNAMQRLNILESFTFTSLPRQWPDREAWYEPGSFARLEKMASHIEWVADVMALDTRRDCSEAIRQRRADARWLRNQAPVRWLLDDALAY